MATPIPENSARFSLRDVAVITVASMPGAAFEGVVIEGIETDSRKNLNGKLFVALTGEQFDGHAFIDAAVQAGARAVLAEREVEASVPVLRVPSTLSALGSLARAHRRRWGGQVVAVAGSAGKTTTRGLVSALFTELWPGQVHSSVGNLNNRVGVPMVLLGLEARHRFAVVEIGTNQPGEVATLTQVSRPEVALLTLIDLEHTAGLGNLKGVEREERDIFSSGPLVALGNGDDERVRRQVWSAPSPERHLYGFGSDCDYRVTDLSWVDLQASHFAYTTPFGHFQLSCPWLAPHVATAALGALAAAESFTRESVAPSTLRRALASPGAREPGRFDLLPLPGGGLLIDDSYNSNPKSLRVAIETASDVAARRNARLHLVLGEMRELGDCSAAEHQRIGALLAALSCASLTAVSGDARWFVTGDPKHVFVETSEQASERLLDVFGEGDVVLIKGSRGVHTERVVTALLESEAVERRVPRVPLASQSIP